MQPLKQVYAEKQREGKNEIVDFVHNTLLVRPARNFRVRLYGGVSYKKMKHPKLGANRVAVLPFPSGICVCMQEGRLGRME